MIPRYYRATGIKPCMCVYTEKLVLFGSEKGFSGRLLPVHSQEEFYHWVLIIKLLSLLPWQHDIYIFYSLQETCKILNYKCSSVAFANLCRIVPYSSFGQPWGSVTGGVELLKEHWRDGCGSLSKSPKCLSNEKHNNAVVFVLPPEEGMFCLCSLSLLVTSATPGSGKGKINITQYKQRSSVLVWALFCLKRIIFIHKSGRKGKRVRTKRERESQRGEKIGQSVSQHSFHMTLIWEMDKSNLHEVHCPLTQSNLPGDSDWLVKEDRGGTK